MKPVPVTDILTVVAPAATTVGETDVMDNGVAVVPPPPEDDDGDPLEQPARTAQRHRTAGAKTFGICMGDSIATEATVRTVPSLLNLRCGEEGCGPSCQRHRTWLSMNLECQADVAAKFIAAHSSFALQLKRGSAQKHVVSLADQTG